MPYKNYDCRLRQSHAYYTANKSQINARARARRAQNLEFYRKRERKWWEKNRAHRVQQQRQRYYDLKNNCFEKILWYRAKTRANKSQLSFTLELKDIIIPKKCPYLKIPLKIGEGYATPNSPSLDRIDNFKGYIPGNVQVISWRANSLKQDATLQELVLLGKYARKLFSQKTIK